ncbi:hypothetical protein [Mycolicibacterium stellerae]|uniref:hypothetical protein n=1 Tax=Mycolicibacterium stellerae TaxID=2358193 RepID=UPI000F0B5776|nr:hypothetical protein [Mycolicibacterium stellerae]
MSTRRRLRGYELRCVLTLHLFQHGKATVADLVDMLDHHRFEVAGRASKAVSDALRCEIAHGRVRRLRRGRYGPASMPRATEYRIHQRALALREEAAALHAQSDEAFWDALFGLDLGDDPSLSTV